MKQLTTLIDTQNIYTNIKLRNAVAYAHQCCDKNGNFMHYKALLYPQSFIVNIDQINEAKAEIKRVKNILIESAKTDNKIYFTGMGMEYQERYDDDVCNHRIRAEFKNKIGRTFFIEFGTGRVNNLRIDHAIDKSLQKRREEERVSIQDYNNFKGLERNGDLGIYSKVNLLSIINKYFNCNFSEIIIDNYNISPDDIISQSI